MLRPDLLRFDRYHPDFRIGEGRVVTFLNRTKKCKSLDNWLLLHFLAAFGQ
jgi:hypothetical protein